MHAGVSGRGMRDIYFEIHIEMVSFYFRGDLVFDGHIQISIDDATAQM